MRRMLLTLAALLVLGLAAQALAASVSVPGVLRSQIAKVSAKSHIPVLLPSRIGGFSKAYGEGSATRNSYRLGLGAVRNCGDATACFIADFFATRGGRPDHARKVRLANGTTGYFRGLSCGASCAPAIVQWVHGGVLYEIQFKDERRIVALANSAIVGGPR